MKGKKVYILGMVFVVLSICGVLFGYAYQRTQEWGNYDSKSAIYSRVQQTLDAAYENPTTSPLTIIPALDYSGTYLLVKGEDSGCTLKVLHEGRLDPYDSIEFELFCTRGSPSYNMGYASDPILFESHVSNMAVWSSPFGECHLVFTFSITGVSVSQIGHTCGFGGGVYASGEYQLKDRKPFTLGCMNPNDAVNPCVISP